MDRIALIGLEFHAYHGFHPEEGKLGARFVVDIEMGLVASKTDDLRDTVDYSAVYSLVRKEVVDKQYQLIDTLANQIADVLLMTQPRIMELTVRVHKPHAPLPGIIRDVYVEVQRQR